jgi:hypothetical protein
VGLAKIELLYVSEQKGRVRVEVRVGDYLLQNKEADIDNVVLEVEWADHQPVS